MADSSELSDLVKRFIVTALACWDTPSTVAAAVKADYGIEITRQRVEAYDPTKVAGKALSKEYRALFTEARKLYLADEAGIGIAQKTFRLRMLERMALKAEAVGNSGMAAQLLEQAAREIGGAFTNRRELSGPDGKPIEMADKTPRASAGQVMNDLREIFGGAIAPAAPAKPAAGDRTIRKGAARRGGKKSGASKTG
jgi:hypothetical protein